MPLTVIACAKLRCLWRCLCVKSSILSLESKQNSSLYHRPKECNVLKKDAAPFLAIQTGQAQCWLYSYRLRYTSTRRGFLLRRIYQAKNQCMNSEAIIVSKKFVSHFKCQTLENDCKKKKALRGEIWHFFFASNTIGCLLLSTYCKEMSYECLQRAALRMLHPWCVFHSILLNTTKQIFSCSLEFLMFGFSKPKKPFAGTKF